MFSWWLPGLDPAAGLLVAVVVLVVLVAGKEQGGPGDPWPAWLRLLPGLLFARSCRSRPGGRSTWFRSWCRIAGGVAGVRLLAG